MDNIDPDTKDREYFAKLLSDSELDDSISEEHQEKLRSEVLNAFDRSDASHGASDLVVQQPATTIHWNNRKTLLAIASIAACLICIVALWSAAMKGFDRSVVAKSGPVSDENIDPLLLATVAEVDALKDTVPADAFFSALAQCELQRETRMQSNTADEMRWLYESSLSNLETPKG